MNIRDKDCLSAFSTNDEKYLTDIVDVIEEDGYVEIVKIQRFIDIDVAILHIRGKDPILSGMYKCTVDVRMLEVLHKLLFKKVHYNFGFSGGSLVVSKNVGVEQFDLKAPTDICNFSSSLCAVPDTPVSFLWKLIVNDYRFIWNKCAPVKCSEVYFGSDNFSIKVDFMNKLGVKQNYDLIKFENGRYSYNEFYVTKATTQRKISVPTDVDNYIATLDIDVLLDDLGRKIKCHKISLEKFEKNLFNMSAFNKMFDNVFTYGVLDTAYNICSYLNGLSLIEHDLNKDARFPIMFLPAKQSDKFNIDNDKEHNDFNIQSIWYSDIIQQDIAHAYKTNKEIITQYLKNKDAESRDVLYGLFSAECGRKYGKLSHYYINGVLDALAIQKGDKATRLKILTGYMKTVNREFLMYGCYLYNMRMMFIRNNYRISKCFKSALVLSDYNYSYFRVG